MILAALGLAVAAAAAPDPQAPQSVVLVQVYRSRYDWSLPWRQEAVEGSLGSGFLIEGGRVVTNAHVVADAREVLVRRPDQANPYVATVEAVGNDCDLAVLSVSDPAFTRGLKPLPLGDVPRSGSRVQTYGFPLGGQDVSSTAGIVSRVESRGYVHSGIDAHLVVQTDAAINPGNSGGPVMQEGRVVGVAFQGYPGFDNMGFFIPMPVVRHFLADIHDGQYTGFPDSGLQTTPLLSPSYRRERGLPEGKGGVVVDFVAPGGTADGVVEPGDVIVAVEGVPVANDGTIGLGARVDHGVAWRPRADPHRDLPPHRAPREQAQPLRSRPALRGLRGARVHAPRHRAAQDLRPGLAADRGPQPGLASPLPRGGAAGDRRPRGGGPDPCPAPCRERAADLRRAGRGGAHQRHDPARAGRRG